MVKTIGDYGEDQAAWRPKNLFHYIQDKYIEPDFVVDITAHWETKVASIKAFRSQFFDPNSSEPASYISSLEFIEFIEARSREMGHKIGVKYGEGFTKTKTISVNDLFDIL
jgi:LmbE family N-acetylglucosaminyl deacetylase